MCFNMSIIKEIEALQEEFRADFSEYPILSDHALHWYNASGFDHPIWPVIGKEFPDSIRMYHWGLIPHWVKGSDQAAAIRSKTLNARGETVDQLPSYRSSFPVKTCLVIAEGFYEPHHFKGKSYPFYLHRSDGRLLTLGGIYAQWTNREIGSVINSFSIITVPAIGLTDRIHSHKHRMPLIIPEDQRRRWIDPELSPTECKALIHSWEPEELIAYPASPDLYRRGGSRNTPEIRNRHYYGIEEIDLLAI